MKRWAWAWGLLIVENDNVLDIDHDVHYTINCEDFGEKHDLTILRTYATVSKMGVNPLASVEVTAGDAPLRVRATGAEQIMWFAPEGISHTPFRGHTTRKN